MMRGAARWCWCCVVLIFVFGVALGRRWRDFGRAYGLVAKEITLLVLARFWRASAHHPVAHYNGPKPLDGGQCPVVLGEKGDKSLQENKQ